MELVHSYECLEVTWSMGAEDLAEIKRYPLELGYFPKLGSHSDTLNNK